MTMKAWVVSLALFTCSGVYAADEVIVDTPYTSPCSSIFTLDVLSTNLDPNTFTITFSLCVAPDHLYALCAHDGPPASNLTYTLVSGCLYPTSSVLLITDSGGSLPTNGRTYRGVIPPICSQSEGSIYTHNEVYIPYPYLTAPTVSIAPLDTNPALARITYGEGLYSNAQIVAPAGDLTFYRLATDDGNPSNAVLQTIGDLESSDWTPVPE